MYHHFTSFSSEDHGQEASGGHELLLYQRAGLEKGFQKLETPFTPGLVKEVVSEAQVYTLYLRPLQKDLQLKAPTVDATLYNEVFSDKHNFLLFHFLLFK